MATRGKEEPMTRSSFTVNPDRAWDIEVGGYMAFQEMLQQHFSPIEREQLQTFLDMLEQHLCPTDWERLHTFIDSMNPERRAAMMRFIAQREIQAPAVGTEAPDFELPRLGSGERVRLSSFRHLQPVVLIFGSFT
jgi:hypothetical protein